METTWRTLKSLVLGGLHFPYFAFQRRGHCRRGGSGNGSHQSGRRNCGWQAKKSCGQAVVRWKLAASQMESAKASMMVALNLSSSILTLSKPLSYFMRCKCTAAKDRDCLDACVDRELLELGDSNRIIVNQEACSQPRVPERKPAARKHSQPCPRRVHNCKNEQPVTTSQRATDTRSCGGGHTRARRQTNTTTTLVLCCAVLCVCVCVCVWLGGSFGLRAH